MLAGQGEEGQGGLQTISGESKGMGGGDGVERGGGGCPGREE